MILRREMMVLSFFRSKELRSIYQLIKDEHICFYYELFFVVKSFHPDLLPCLLQNKNKFSRFLMRKRVLG